MILYTFFRVSLGSFAYFYFSPFPLWTLHVQVLTCGSLKLSATDVAIELPEIVPTFSVSVTFAGTQKV